MPTTLITNYGQNAIASAIANEQTINIVKIALGDGAGAIYKPTATQTALKNKVYESPLNDITINPDNQKQVIFESLLGSGAGGFYIREIGLIDDKDGLIAVSDFPESFKAVADQYELYVRMALELSNTNIVNIVVNNNLVFATKKYIDDIANKKVDKVVGKGLSTNDFSTAYQKKLDDLTDASTTAKGVVQLTDSVTSTSTTTAATANAVKNLNDKLINTSASIGTLDMLATTDKKTIVDAVNELFTNVSDSKSLIANAIIDKGITVSTSDNFTQLATAISNIDAGKKSAQGTMMMPSVNRNLIVRGLSFKPRVIVYSYYRDGLYNGVYSTSTPSISSVLTRDDNYWYSIIPVTIYEDGFMVSGLVSSGSNFSDIAVVWSAFE